MLPTPIVFVLLLISSDGGIDTNLRFVNELSCLKAAHAAAHPPAKRQYGASHGDRYLKAICVPAEGLLR